MRLAVFGRVATGLVASLVAFQVRIAGAEQHPAKQVDPSGLAETTDRPRPEGGAYSADQIKTAVRSYLRDKTLAGGGVFRIRDGQDGRDLELNFVRIQDPVREVEGRGYVTCTDFSAAGGKNVYDIDFWLNPKGGNLVVTETVIHKKDGIARFTHQNDRPVALN